MEAVAAAVIFGAGIMLPIIFMIGLAERRNARRLRALRGELVQSGSIIPASIDRSDP